MQKNMEYEKIFLVHALLRSILGLFNFGHTKICLKESKDILDIVNV